MSRSPKASADPEIRDLLRSVEGATIAVPVAFVRAFGVVPAVFLRQLVFWQGQKGAGVWFYKSVSEATAETGLTRRNQETARKALRQRKVIEEGYAGNGGTLHYRVRLARLRSVLANGGSVKDPDIPAEGCGGTSRKAAAEPAVRLRRNQPKAAAGSRVGCARFARGLRANQPQPSSSSETSRDIQRSNGDPCREASASADQLVLYDGVKQDDDATRREREKAADQVSLRDPEVLAAFEAGWKETRDVGARTGSKRKARSQWAVLLRTGGLTPAEGLERWRAFQRLQDVEWWPEVHRLLNPGKEYLTDDALQALEVRRKRPQRGRADASVYVNTGIQTNPDAERNRARFRKHRQKQKGASDAHRP